MISIEVSAHLSASTAP